MTTDCPVLELSEEDATLILFAGIARSSYYNGLARPVNLFAYVRRGLNMKWLPDDLQAQARIHSDDAINIFRVLRLLQEQEMIKDLGSAYAMTQKGAVAVDDLLWGRNYTLDTLTYYVGR